jgi:exonuclease SbcD
VKLLHTSDWHVGKAIRGHSRAGEHRAVLAEVAEAAAAHGVDLTVVAGDLFDSAAPTAESERIAYDALLALAQVSPVVVVAGNHDSARRLDAVARLLALGRVTVASEARPAHDGGLLELSVADGTPVRLALLPFVSQRAVVRADALMSEAAFRHAQSYAERVSAVIAALTAGFAPDSVNLVAAHLFVAGGTTGGGERSAHLVEAYGVSPQDFPASASYVALGHLHRPQLIRGPAPLHYCGSPLQLDFGEADQAKQVNLVELEPGLAAKVTALPLTAGRPLVTVTGTVPELEAIGPDLAGAWLRAVVTESPRAGLADEVRAVLGDGVVDVRVERPASRHGGGPARPSRDGRTPAQLFAAYLQQRDVVDHRLEFAFAALYDEVHEPDPAPDIAPEPAAAPEPVG